MIARSWADIATAARREHRECIALHREIRQATYSGLGYTLYKGDAMVKVLACAGRYRRTLVVALNRLSIGEA